MSRKLNSAIMRVVLTNMRLTMRKRAIVFLALVAACWAGSVWAIEPVALSTSNISITLQASDHAPRLTLLRGSSGFRISNQAIEALPASVEVNGTSVPLKWEIKRKASKHDKKHV